MKKFLRVYFSILWQQSRWILDLLSNVSFLYQIFFQTFFTYRPSQCFITKRTYPYQNNYEDKNNESVLDSVEKLIINHCWNRWFQHSIDDITEPLLPTINTWTTFPIQPPTCENSNFPRTQNYLASKRATRRILKLPPINNAGPSIAARNESRDLLFS